MGAVVASAVMVVAAVAAALTTAPPERDDFRPDVIRWGATTAEMEAALQGKCAKGYKIRPINPPFLEDIKDRQLQIDCDGLQFMGAPRWTEFVIGDGRLKMVWLMVKPEDQDAVVAAMTKAYGPPSSRNSTYIAFAQARAAWRFKPAEILFYAPELDASTTPDFAAGK